MARRMVDNSFSQAQWQQRYDPHIAPINRLVDALRMDTSRGWAPYVAPMYGGIHARLLSVLRDPGPKTQDDSGSGLLCMENDDQTAEAISRRFEDAGIDAKDIVPWNAYPWYINRAPKASELDAGVEPLKQVIHLMPKLRLVMLHGGSAHDVWRRLIRGYPDIATSRSIELVKTYHPSRQALWTPDASERERRKKHLHDAFRSAGSRLRSG